MHVFSTHTHAHLPFCMHAYPPAVHPAWASCRYLCLKHSTGHIFTAVTALHLHCIGQFAEHVECLPTVTVAGWEVSFPIPYCYVSTLCWYAR